MRRIIPAVIIAILFHVALFALDPGLIMKRPGDVKKPAITVTMSYRKKPVPPPPVNKPPEIKKKKKVKVVKKIKEPAPLKEKKPVPVPAPVKEQKIAEDKTEIEEEFDDQDPIDNKNAESKGPVTDEITSAVVTEAMPLYSVNPAPGYPKMARKRGYQGTVLLNVLVNKEGTVEDLWLSESSGYKILDNAALKAVKDWTFEPGRRGDKAVEMWVEVPVIFELK